MPKQDKLTLFFSENIKPYLDKLIDKIDPLELTAILTLTYFIKNTIDWSQTNLSWIQQRGLELPLITPLADIIRGYVKQYQDIPNQTEWLMSFLLAYLVIRYGDKLIESGKNITQFAGLLLLK